MADALFYTPAQLKRDTTISSNVDEKYLTEIILYCQDRYIHPKLGTTFYDELKSDVIGSSLSGVNKTLMDDYIRPALKWYAASEVIEEVSHPITNKGVVERDGEASTPAERRVIGQKAEKYLDRAEYYADTLIKYLCENESSYPNYQNPATGAHIKKPETNAFTASIYLGNADS